MPTTRVGRRRLRTLSALLTLSAVLALTTACGHSGPGTTADGKDVLRYQGQSGIVTAYELADSLGYFSKIQLHWESDTTSGPANIQAAATKQIEFGSAFNGAVVKLVSGGAPVKSVLASYGSDDLSFGAYLVKDNSPINSARDLIGKKIAVNTLGAHYEFVAREWLHDNGLTEDEIKSVQFVVIPPVSAEEALRNGQVDVAALSSPFLDVADQRGGVRTLFTDKALFGKFDYGTYVFRTDYIAAHPDAVKDFVQGTARAIRWLQTTPTDQVQAKFRAVIAARGRNENDGLVKIWKSPGIPVPGAVIAEKEIQIWIDWLGRNGDQAAGKLHAADLFTNQYNPYANGTYPSDSGPNGEAIAK
ncbi:ABC transporter substrate-binding protein [Nocardia stercoris]|uniref:ABC transporter substrate-binding protein n=1 Tax=Nocardia stercoris TaxID=2483361 RepID=A0A3M2KXX5_9NOCA|nr:ABC transporter substrate-binding protein [Nocardia stercoris]RMI30367.1 ABC transporter substrate-binding protein [Nocardia stercoris]